MYCCSESGDVTWSVNDVSSASEGVYACIATNSAGSNAARTRLDVTGKRYSGGSSIKKIEGSTTPSPQGPVDALPIQGGPKK